MISILSLINLILPLDTFGGLKPTEQRLTAKGKVQRLKEKMLKLPKNKLKSLEIRNRKKNNKEKSI
jgi:hypothetical protein